MGCCVVMTPHGGHSAEQAMAQNLVYTFGMPRYPHSGSAQTCSGCTPTDDPLHRRQIARRDCRRFGRDHPAFCRVTPMLAKAPKQVQPLKFSSASFRARPKPPQLWSKPPRAGPKPPNSWSRPTHAAETKQLWSQPHQSCSKPHHLLPKRP